MNIVPMMVRDRGEQPMQNFATNASIKAIYASENAAVSSVINLTDDTTMIEVVAIGALPTAAVMRWVTSVAGFNASTSVISAAGTANFDHVLSNNIVTKIAVPIEKMGPQPTSIVGVNISNGLYRRVAIKSIGIASVLLTEY